MGRLHLFRVLFLVAAMTLMSAAVQPAPRPLAAVAHAPVPEELNATVELDLSAGEFAWHAVTRDTVGDDDPMAEFPSGVLIALDDPLLVFVDGQTSMRRLTADTAMAMPEAKAVRAVAMMTEVPVTFLTVEVADPADLADEEKTLPFRVQAGTHTMHVWYVDNAVGVSDTVMEHLQAQTLPMLLVVRSGEIEIPADSADETARQHAAGESVVVEPGTQIAAAPDSEPPVLLLITLTPPQDEAASQPAQGGSVPQAPVAPRSGAAPAEPPVTAKPPVTAEPTVTPTPIHIGGGDPSQQPGSSAPDDGSSETTTDDSGSEGDVIPNPDLIDPPPIDVPPQAPPEENGGGVEDVDNPVPPGSLDDDTPGGVEDVDNPAPDIVEDKPAGETGDAGASGQGNVIILGNTGNISMARDSNGTSSADRISQVETGAKVQDVADDDHDGLINAREAEWGTQTDSADSDGDGLSDGEEVHTHQTHPLTVDTDGDGLADGNEVNSYKTLPSVADSDNDGLDDGYELGANLDPRDPDYDDDELTDGDEMNIYGTYPKIYDSDEDGLGDGVEMNVHGTNPLNPHSDSDCLADGEEVLNGLNPINPDSDGDGEIDLQHVYPGSICGTG